MAEGKALATTYCGIGSMASTMVVWGKALGNLRRRHAPCTGDVGKVGLRAAFLRDDFVYL